MPTACVEQTLEKGVRGKFNSAGGDFVPIHVHPLSFIAPVGIV